MPNPERNETQRATGKARATVARASLPGASHSLLT